MNIYIQGGINKSIHFIGNDGTELVLNQTFSSLKTARNALFAIRQATKEFDMTKWSRVEHKPAKAKSLGQSDLQF